MSQPARRRITGIGQSLRKVLEEVDPGLAIKLLGSARDMQAPLLGPIDLQGSDTDRDDLLRNVADQDADIRASLEAMCRDVVILGTGKGVRSLETIAERRLSNVDHDRFDEQVDELSRSIWIRIGFYSVFEEARSFHAARSHRENTKLYTQYETQSDTAPDIRADELDTDAFGHAAVAALGLKTQPTVTALDLPKTKGHPASIMVVLRHGGSLSSIIDHGKDGARTPLHYRPSDEAVFIYTPSLRRLEVCAASYLVREKTSDAFARTVLEQDLSTKPLLARTFDLGRFRSSFGLPLPDFDDLEVTSAAVVCLNIRLGSWSRLMTLKVTKDDDIGVWAEGVMGKAMQAAQTYGYSRIEIAVAYQFPGGRTGTFSIGVSANNSSTVQGQADPDLRALGHRLLEWWGVATPFRDLDQGETLTYFDALLALHDRTEDKITGSGLREAGIEAGPLVRARILEKAGRQDVILIDDDDLGPGEGELELGDDARTLKRIGPFGEGLGTVSIEEAKIYVINRPWLSEKVLDPIRRALGADRVRIEEPHVAEFGEVAIGENRAPVYLARGLSNEHAIWSLDIWFRRRQKLGYGVILTIGETGLRYLGPNIVVPIATVLLNDGDEVTIDADALENVFLDGRHLAWGGEKADLVRSTDRSATLFMPGQPPLPLEDKQATMFERLVVAYRTDNPDVPTRALMKDFGSNSPQDLFKGKRWGTIKDRYLHIAKRRSWRLGPFV